MLDYVSSNWPLKLLALALAFAIWVSVTGENRIVQDFQVPLEVRLAEGFVLASTTPTTVSVRLRGSESLVRRLDPVPMVVRAELESVPPGETDVQLSRDDLHGIPRGVDVDFINPDRLRLTVDRQLRRELPVEPTFLGQPAEGFAFYGARVNPRTLPVEGPETAVQALELLRTNPIRLDRRSTPFVARVGVVPESEVVRVADPRPVQVRVIVDATAVERRFENLPVRLLGAASGAAASPRTLDVTLSGPPGIVDRMSPEQVRVIVDVSGRRLAGRTEQVDVRVQFSDIPAEEQERLTVKSISRRRVGVTLGGAS